MLNNMDTQLELKSSNLKAVLGSPQLSKLIKDALKSPLGSTKRLKARNILSSLQKTSQNYFNDGQGGSPYSPYPGVISPYPTGQEKSSLINPTPAATLQKPITPVATQPVQPQSTSAIPQSPYDNWTSPYATPEKVDVVPGLPLPPKKTTIASPTTSASTATSIVPPYGATADGISRWYQESPDEVNQWLNNISGVSGTVTPSAIADIAQPTGIPSGMWNDLKSSVEGGIGAETWKYMALPQLKEWFPDVPEADLPTGAIWTNDIPAIKERLNEEYQLNSQLDNVNKLDAQGLTIESDLQAYVRGRDKYIKNINGMIDNVNNLYTDTDVSDPRVRSMLDKYRNYLYMSKGRQEVRYNDYVTRSVTEHQLRLQTAVNAYNSSLKQYESDLADEKDITQGKYDMYSSMLKDMYNSLDAREKEINKIGDNQIASLASGLNNLVIIKEALATLSGTAPGMKLTESNLNTSYNNYLQAHPSNSDNYNKWYALSDDEKRGWLTAKASTYDEMVKKIEVFQSENASVEDINSVIELSGYSVEDFADIMEGYGKKWFWGKPKK
jgi:hypothetical protein